MPDFLAAIQNNQPDELLAIRALEILESETNGSHQIYWAAKYIHSFNNEDSRYDRKILDVLDKLIEAGLSYNKFPEIFLDIFWSNQSISKATFTILRHFSGTSLQSSPQEFAYV